MATAARGNIACDKGEVGLVDGTHQPVEMDCPRKISYMLVAIKTRNSWAVEGQNWASHSAFC